MRKDKAYPCTPMLLCLKKKRGRGVLFFSCCVTNDHKCSGLKEHKFISSQTQHSMIRLILCSPKAKAKATVS